MIPPFAVAVRLALGVLLACAAARTSAAQNPAESFTQLPRVLDIGSVIYVEDDSGRRTKGRVEDLSGSSLVLTTSSGAVRQARSFSADRVIRITRVDSKMNGFLIGFAVGAVPGILLASGLNRHCYNEGPDYCPSAFFILGGLVGAAGGAIGWKIDDGIDGETIVFAKRLASSTPSVRVTPTLTQRGAGIFLSVRF